MARFKAVAAPNNTDQDIGNWYIKGVSKIICCRLRGWADTSGNPSPVCQLSNLWEETATSKVIQTRPSSTAFLGAA